MIPKVIHYCWFGGNPLPESAKKCIESWKKFFPDYEIKQWNELNYDVKKIPYIADAYKEKKYAFVSDFARFDILYELGGVYFDTDVEVIKSIDDILEKGAFMGCERDGIINSKGVKNAYINKGIGIAVNSGIGIAAPKGLSLYKTIIEDYKMASFKMEDGSNNLETVVTRITRILKKEGLQNQYGIQNVGGIYIYPSDYFNPWHTYTGVMNKTENTRAIHWYDASWQGKDSKAVTEFKRFMRRVFGEDIFERLRGK